MWIHQNIIINKIRQRWISIVFVFIVIVALLLRLYKLENIPNGFANDEAAIAYQSYSILETGKDTWGKPFPLFSFRDFGEHLPPFSVYAMLPFIKFMGLNALSTRLPFALTALIALFPLFTLTKELFNNKKIGLVACFLFAISPLNIGWSRFVFEGNFGMLFYLLGITFLVLSKRKIRHLPFAAFFFGLTFTTYHIFFFVTPITALVLSAPLLSTFYKKANKTVIISIIISAIFALYALAIVGSGSGRERFRQVSIFNDQQLLINLNARQSYCRNIMPNVLCKLVFNKGESYLYQYMFNYMTHFSPTFLSLDGTFLRQAILPKHGLIYPFELPFILIAIYFLIRNFSYSSYVLISLLLIYPLANSFTGVGEISRIAQVMPIFPILSAFGIVEFFKKVNRLYKPILLSIVVVFALFNVVGFLINYFLVFPKTNGYFDSDAYVKLFYEIKKSPNRYSNYYITRNYEGNSPEYQARIFLPIPPQAFQDSSRNEYQVKQPQNYVDYNRIDNYHFFNDFSEINPAINDLVVLNYSQKNLAKKIEFSINEDNGDPALIAVAGGNLNQQ